MIIVSYAILKYSGFLGDLISRSNLHEQDIVDFQVMDMGEDIPLIEMSSINKDQDTFIRLLRLVLSVQHHIVKEAKNVVMNLYSTQPSLSI